MCFDAKDMIVRRVELHHPGADDRGWQALIDAWNGAQPPTNLPSLAPSLMCTS